MWPFGKKGQPPPPSEPEVLLEAVCPDGNLQATVQSDGRTVYLYLAGPADSDFGMRAVWMRNLGEAPQKLDKSAMQQGRPPMNPAAFCRPDMAQQLPDRAALNVVWLPEGNGVELREDAEVIAIVPPWSGTQGFHGYSAAALGEGPLAWALDPDNALLERFRRADAYWDSWDVGDRWAETQEATLAAYDATFGKHSRYFAIDGGEWPPKALVFAESGDATVLATVGVGLRPQPNVELATEDYRTVARIELAIAVPAGWDDAALKGLASYLSGLASYPWAEQSWLGSGHTIPCNAWLRDELDHALVRSTHPVVETPNLPVQDGDPVSLLWLLPITSQERALAEQEGSETLYGALPPTRWREA